MAKRPRVPAALHSELTEYSSLLRALRTSNTLDLVQHLAEPPPSPLRTVSVAADSLVDQEDHESLDDLPLTESASRGQESTLSSSIRSHSTGHNRKRIPSGKARQRDTWTRWPLLAGDVHVPEWGLQDEVHHVARQVLAHLDDKALESAKRDADGPGSPSHDDAFMAALSDEESQERSTLSPVALRALASDSAVFLTRVLALMAAHVPNAEKSMQNRLRPINWESIVDVASTHGVVEQEVVERVRTRLSRMYPPSQPVEGSHRLTHLSAMKSHLSDLLSRYDNNLFESSVIPAEAKGGRKRKRNRTKREASVSVEPEPSEKPKRRRKG
ncbi:hypothetical protein C8Q78DRAFT_1077841 [Trametes maxima]|nr:hypothetical protein C8Q78DRAFT_1077841 [Trametes maxima]